MTLRELAHLAQQTLKDRAGCPVKRSHVHELLAAAFGHRSWAAFLKESVLPDAGVGSAPTGGLPELIGRAVQLGYGQQAAATSLAAFIAEHQLSAISWADLRAALMPAAPRRSTDATSSTKRTMTTKAGTTSCPRLRRLPQAPLASS
jgi:hypothetical protein